MARPHGDTGECAIPQRREQCSGVLRGQPKVNITNNAFSADEPQWDATIFTAPASGRLLDTHKLWAWQLAPSWLPHCRGRWPDSGKQGREPLLSGPSVPEYVWRSSTLTPPRRRRYGPPRLAGPTWCSGHTVRGQRWRPRPPATGGFGTTVAPPPGWRGRRIRVSSTGSLPLTAIWPRCLRRLSPKVLVRGRRW